MTQLPATYHEALEAEALAFARDAIARSREPQGAFHPDSETIYAKQEMLFWMRFYPSFGPDDVVYFAEKGSQPAHEALVELYGEYRQRREDPPVSVEAYALRVLNPARRGKNPGPGKAANFIRDIGIAELVPGLNERFGLALHKNPGSHRPTASTVAAKALTEARIGIVIGPKGVEKIWGRFGPILIDRFPASPYGPKMMSY
jgi:hypothetical protein